MGELTLKTKPEIAVMREGGRKLARVKAKIAEVVKAGVNAEDVEKLADKLIKEEGGEASFRKVPGYRWATCVNVNTGVVHGIPKKEIVFKKGDLVSIDVGMFYKGFHTDTSFSKVIEPAEASVRKFLAAGERALKKAISKAKVGGRIYDISEAIEKEIEAGGYAPIRALVGHGVGRALHEDPQIPCFTIGKREDSPELSEGMVLAIEVMYAMSSPNLVIEKDGWTISTQDGKIAALFEETVALTPHGPLVLTA